MTNVSIDDHCWAAALDGDLSPQVSEHLAGCTWCAEMVERVQRAAMGLQAEIPRPPAGLDIRVLAGLEHERQRARRLSRPTRLRRLNHSPGRPTRRAVALAVVLSALLVAALVVVRPSSLVSNNVQAARIVPLADACLGGQRLVVAGVWSGKEATEFAKVLGLFQERTGIQVVYAYETRSIATKIASLIKQQCPPDVAMLPQPGTMDALARRGALQPLAPIVGDLIKRNYSPAWRRLGTVDGKLYGVWFKAASKSMIWYRPAAFREAGIAHPPQTWTELLADAGKLRAVGVQPFAIAGADGWTLTDWFSNVYLATAGPIRYQQLAENKLKWTDPSVKHALAQLGTLFANRSLTGSLADSSKTTFEQSVNQVFGPHPSAAMVFEGDFVRSFLPAALPASQAKIFAFPRPQPDTEPAIEVGGDVAVLISKSSDGKRLIRFLASAAAGDIWARAGGFISPNRTIPNDSYPDPLTRQLAARIVNAPTIRFGLSDQEPPAFGSDPNQGMWLMFQQFLAHPHNITVLSSKLEAGATAAQRCERAVAGDC